MPTILDAPRARMATSSVPAAAMTIFNDTGVLNNALEAYGDGSFVDCHISTPTTLQTMTATTSSTATTTTTASTTAISTVTMTTTMTSTGTTTRLATPGPTDMMVDAFTCLAYHNERGVRHTDQGTVVYI